MTPKQRHWIGIFLNGGRRSRPAQYRPDALPGFLEIRDPWKEPSQFYARGKLATCIECRTNGRDLIFAQAEYAQMILTVYSECSKGAASERRVSRQELIRVGLIDVNLVRHPVAAPQSIDQIYGGVSECAIRRLCS